MPFLRKSVPVFLLLLAFALRAWQLTAVPPGLTHDEAGHGHDAAGILKGVTLIYFTVGYGREPLFDYFNAGLIAGMGASPFTLRFSAAIWGMIALAATYRAARIGFGREAAAIALALMAVSFWPLATSRQVLRSAMLPGEMAIAAILFLELTAKNAESAKKKWLLVTGLGITIAASLYTYIPARALWLMFPMALITHHISRFARPHASGAGNREPGTRNQELRTKNQSLLSIPLALLFASPLFLYLYQHPEAEQRIGMLSAPLIALQNGDPSLLLNNVREFILAFFLPGHGDHFLAYTIPGRPIFDPITFVLFLIGLAILLRSAIRNPQSAIYSFLLLFWLALGLAPAIITGPEALTTRIVGAQPVLYIIPALGLSHLLASLRRQRLLNFGILRFAHCSLFIVSLFIASLFIATARDYFSTWAQSPDVRAAYQSTLIAMLKAIDGPTVISTVYPSAAHDPYIGELYTKEETRWVDGRLAMIIPADAQFQLLAPSSTPLHSFFAPFIQPVETVDLRSTDLDPTFTRFRLLDDHIGGDHIGGDRIGGDRIGGGHIGGDHIGGDHIGSPLQAGDHIGGDHIGDDHIGDDHIGGGHIGGGHIGGDHTGGDHIGSPLRYDAIEIVAQRWSADGYRPGDVAEFVSIWRVLDPSDLGPLHPPAFKTDLNLFTHVLNPDGSIFLQQDRLDAPSWQWQTGDIIIQIHPFAIPPDAAPGEYAVEVGLYDRITGDRLATQDGADHVVVDPLIIK